MIEKSEIRTFLNRRDLLNTLVLITSRYIPPRSHFIFFFSIYPQSAAHADLAVEASRAQPQFHRLARAGVMLKRYVSVCLQLCPTQILRCETSSFHIRRASQIGTGWSR